MAITPYKRGEIYWIRFTDSRGKRVARSLRTSSEREANKRAAETIRSYRAKEEEGHTLEDALVIWLKAYDRTASEKSSIRKLLEHYPNRPLSQINGHDIQDALSHLKPATYNRTANNIRAAINMAVDRGWCKPVKIPRKKVVKKTPRFLSKDEWERLKAELPTHLKPIVIFSLATGLRKSNVINLNWQQVDMAKKVAWVNAEHAKGKKTITIPLSTTALDVLYSLNPQDIGRVFTFKGEPILDVRRAWNNALKRAEIDNFRWHDLRHTWASWHVQSGTPLAVLKELGGWSDISMVMVYAHLAPEHLSQWADNAL